MPKTITRDDLHASIINGSAPILLEALPEKYFAEGHLPGARSLPNDDVEARAPSLVPDKAAPIVVYCASETCRNSHEAAAVLESIGYTDVAVYPGGKNDWRTAGYEFETE